MNDIQPRYTPRPNQPLQVRRETVLQPSASFAAEQANMQPAPQQQSMPQAPPPAPAPQPMMQPAPNMYPMPQHQDPMTLPTFEQEKEIYRNDVKKSYGILILGILAAIFPAVSLFIITKLESAPFDSQGPYYLLGAGVALVPIFLAHMSEKKRSALDSFAVIGLVGSTIAIVNTLNFYIAKEAISAFFGF